MLRFDSFSEQFPELLGSTSWRRKPRQLLLNKVEQKLCQRGIERKGGGVNTERERKKALTISSLTLLTKGDVVRNLLTAVNIFPSNVAAFPTSRPCEHPGPMSASPGLGNNPRQSRGKSLFFSLLAGPRGSSSFTPRLAPTTITPRALLPPGSLSQSNAIT